MSTFRLSVVTAALVLGMGAIGGVPGLTAAGVAHAQTAPATTLSSAQLQSLVMFPDVLSMMAGKLSWVQQLGDAYLSQPKDLMAAVQALRARAKAAGNLSSNQHVAVSSEQSSIIIQPANFQVVYVPQYNPAVVYGAWP